MDKEQLMRIMMVDKKVTFSEEAIASLVACSSEVTLPARHIFQYQGEKQEQVYYLLDGLVRSYYLDDEGKDTTKQFLRSGDFVQGEALFMPEGLESFETLEVTRLLVFDAVHLKQAIRQHPDLLLFYSRLLEETLIYKMEREYQLQHLQAGEKYELFRKAYPDLEKRAPHYMIASYLGLSKETFSRIRKKYEKNQD